MGLVLRNGSYALDTSGDVALVGLDGLEISGGFKVRANKLRQAVNETVSTPDGPVVVRFDTAAEVLSFGGEATLKVGGVFELHGEVMATKLGSGVILIDVPDVSLKILNHDQEIFAIGAKARFGIGGGRGFQLFDIGVTNISVLGVAVSATGGSLPTFEMPPDEPLSAQLTTIVDGVDKALLNRQQYLDVTFDCPADKTLDQASILDAAAEFTLIGAGVGDAELQSVEHVDGNTYRYRLRDKNTSNELGLFQPGAVHVNFLANTWTDSAGQGNAAATADFTVRDGSAKTGDPTKLGPLTLQGPSFSLEDFQFKPLKDADGKLNGALLTITVGIGVEKAALSFGSGNQQSDSGLTVELTDLKAVFDVGITLDVPACLPNLFSNPFSCITGASFGKFRIDVGALDVSIANVLKADAHGIVIQYNPTADEDGDGTVSTAEQEAFDSQEILRLNDASVTITKINVTGSVGPYTRHDGTTIPGLLVRKNAVHFGQAQLSYNSPISIGGFLNLDDIRAGVTDFGVTFGGSVDFNGQVYIAAGGAELLPGQAFSMSIKDGPDADTEAVRAGLSFTNGVPSGFQFKADQLEMHLSSYLTITGSGIEIDSEATGDEYVASFASLGAVVTAGPLKVTGKMKNFAFTADGDFVTLPGFGVFLSTDQASAGSFGWPEWLPIRLTSPGHRVARHPA